MLGIRSWLSNVEQYYRGLGFVVSGKKNSVLFQKGKSRLFIDDIGVFLRFFNEIRDNFGIPLLVFVKPVDFDVHFDVKV